MILVCDADAMLAELQSQRDVAQKRCVEQAVTLAQLSREVAKLTEANKALENQVQELEAAPGSHSPGMAVEGVDLYDPRKDEPLHE
jgi:hypothetical protein